MSKSDKLISDHALILDRVFQIGQALAAAKHWKPALDEVVPLLREIIIFDNLVLYLPDDETHNLEVAYARVIGRGRSVGPDINWGESVANQALNTGKLVHLQPQLANDNSQRLDLPYLLANPIVSNSGSLGVLVLIRFGGPPYSEESIRITTYLADGIAQILRYVNVNKRVVQLEAMQKQTQLQEDFVSTISHELLTPLGFIKGYTTTLLRADATWDEKNQKEFLTIIEQESDRLQELIDNLLDSARLQSGTMSMEFQPVRLDVLLKDVSMRIKQNNPNLEIELNSNQPSQSIQGDPRRLAQVFENLLNNAVKYAPGSPIFITVIENEEDVKISIEDRGPGIPREYLPHLFERFFRNPEQAPNIRGTGLGLFICRQIIDAHQGIISLASEQGKGTEISVSLPYLQPTSSKTAHQIRKQ
jgi:signal transduction histidine kinase